MLKRSGCSIFEKARVMAGNNSNGWLSLSKIQLRCDGSSFESLFSPSRLRAQSSQARHLYHPATPFLCFVTTTYGLWPVASKMTEYDVGSTLKVLYSPFSADGHKAPLAAERELTFEIIRAFRPFSLSVVGEVKPVGDQASLDLQLLLSQPFAPRNETGTFIIKLYDRRYDTNNREFRDKNRPYTEDREPAYHAYVSEYGDDVWWPDESDTGDDIEPGMVEAILENNKRRMFTLESEIYARITTGLLRGDRPAAPYFYGTVKYECAIGVVSGILIEYIHQSISVFDYLLSVGSCGYSDEAVRTVINRVGESLNSLMKYDFMNTDNRPEDILLWHPTGK